MPTPDLYPLPLVALADRLNHEMRMSESVYYVPRIDWWVADPDFDVSKPTLTNASPRPLVPLRVPTLNWHTILFFPGLGAVDSWS